VNEPGNALLLGGSQQVLGAIDIRTEELVPGSRDPNPGCDMDHRILLCNRLEGSGGIRYVSEVLGEPGRSGAALQERNLVTALLQ
jgi:hypothetical protein